MATSSSPKVVCSCTADVLEKFVAALATATGSAVSACNWSRAWARRSWVPAVSRGGCLLENTQFFGPMWREESDKRPLRRFRSPRKFARGTPEGEEKGKNRKRKNCCFVRKVKGETT